MDEDVGEVIFGGMLSTAISDHPCSRFGARSSNGPSQDLILHQEKNAKKGGGKPRQADTVAVVEAFPFPLHNSNAAFKHCCCDGRVMKSGVESKEESESHTGLRSAREITNSPNSRKYPSSHPFQSLILSSIRASAANHWRIPSPDAPSLVDPISPRASHEVRGGDFPLKLVPTHCASLPNRSLLPLSPGPPLHTSLPEAILVEETLPLPPPFFFFINRLFVHGRARPPYTT